MTLRGRRPTLPDELAGFAFRYADQVRRDYGYFLERFEAETSD